MPDALPTIYNVRPKSYYSFLGYRDITGDGERGGGGGGSGEMELSPLKCKYIYLERGNMPDVLLYVYLYY